jgi:hypothetical protein
MMGIDGELWVETGSLGRLKKLERLGVITKLSKLLITRNLISDFRGAGLFYHKTRGLGIVHEVQPEAS